MLAAGLAMLAVDASPAPPQIQFGAVALTEIRACLQGMRWTPDARHRPASAADAPGLPPNMSVARITDAPGRLFVYQDAGGSVVECGVAAYDALPQDFIILVDAAVRTAKPGLRAHAAAAWRFEGPPSPVTLYWDDPQAPGLSGVLMRAGGDGTHAPVLQVDSHSVLIR